MSHMVRGNTSFTEENKDILIEAIKELDTKLTNIENQLNSGN